MRVMVLVKATADSESVNGIPSKEMMDEMGRFNDKLKSAGLLRAADGLKPRRLANASHSKVPAAPSLTVPFPT